MESDLASWRKAVIKVSSRTPRLGQPEVSSWRQGSPWALLCHGQGSSRIPTLYTHLKTVLKQRYFNVTLSKDTNVRREAEFRLAGSCEKRSRFESSQLLEWPREACLEAALTTPTSEEARLPIAQNHCLLLLLVQLEFCFALKRLLRFYYGLLSPACPSHRKKRETSEWKWENVPDNLYFETGLRYIA